MKRNPSFWFKFLPAILLIALFSFSIYKKSDAAALRDFQTAPVTQEDGDTIKTFQVSCASFTAATLMTSTTTNGVTLQNIRQIRRRTFQNIGGYKVWIGTNTASLATTGYLLNVATMASTGAVFTTHNTSTFYCLSDPGAPATNAVSVIEEYNSFP